MFKRLWWPFTDYFRDTDKPLILTCLAATLFGCVAVLSTTAYTGSRRQFIVQFAAMIIGLGLAVAISLYDYSGFKKSGKYIAAFALILVGLTFVIGVAPEGTDAKAWIELPIINLTFQPAELLKIAFVITFSLHLSALKENINKPLYLLTLLVHGAIPIAIIHFQGDDGTAIIFGIIMIAMLLAAGLKWRYFAIMGGLAAAAAPVLYFFVLSSYQKERILAMFDLEADLQGIGWQQWRGRMALANGGFFGQGLFNGQLTQAGPKNGGVPEGYNDFIFVSIGEETGFLGCFIVIALLAVICFLVLNVAKNSRDLQGRYLCAGIFAIFISQIIINLGMCLSVLPVIGVTLPFFSAGGTSLVVTYVSIGIVLSVYMHKSSRVLLG
ncbi:MAG: FtsW/RodA/SpoVE family cell cycle protein [Oscillospiraceae bacterium]|nr:FtsW/RodA/SpoVE family cell cycle protein [Candidatus Equicaccousia limihippi]